MFLKYFNKPILIIYICIRYELCKKLGPGILKNDQNLIDNKIYAVIFRDFFKYNYKLMK